MVRKYSPSRSGESTSVVSEAGENSMVSPDSFATASAVPYFQPCGRRRLVAYVSSSEGHPFGYRST